MGEHEVATDMYRRASQDDDTNTAALHGMIYCQIKQSQLEDAEQQLEAAHEQR